MGTPRRTALSNAPGLVLGIWVALASCLTAEPQSPEFAALENLVRQYFFQAQRRQDKPLLLTQSQVRDLLEELRGMHIYIPRRHQIVRSFPHDQEFFTRFVLQELAQDPAMLFPDDPTPLFQRIDTLCAGHNSIRQFLRIAGRGEAFLESWGPRENLFPQLDEQVRLELEEAAAFLGTDEGPPRRRNYTIEHLTEVLREAYHPSANAPAKTSSFHSLGR